MDKSGTSHIARSLRGESPSEPPSLARGFRLGPWRVRPDLCTLESADRRVPLEPKIMGVLLSLAQHAPRVVTREQFIAEVWNGRAVTDEVLSRAISLLRAELGDDAQDPRFIRTVPRVGYTLIAPVEPLATAEVAADTRAPRDRRRWLAAAVGISIFAALAGWWWLARDAGDAVAGPVRLAVLPLASPGGGSDAMLADGLTEELTTSLAHVPGLRVVARNSALRFRSETADLAEAAESLGATHLLSGSLRSSGDRLRVNVHLADSATGTEAWAESYDRTLDDLFGVQADVADAVAAALRHRLVGSAGPGPGASARAESPPANADSYRLYLLGRQQLARRGEEGLEAAIGLLEQSIAADPNFLRARLALAWASTLLASTSPAHAEAAAIRVDRELAAVARETAMSGEVQAVRAWLELERNQWIEAEAAFREALEFDPDETELRLLYSQMQGALGEREAAGTQAQQALLNDPLSPAATLRLAVLRLWSDDEAGAARLLAQARELGLAPSASPEVPMLLYVRHREFEGLEKALHEVQERRSQSRQWISPVILALEDPRHGAAAEAALEQAAAAGQVDALLHFGALVLAGRHERALRWLLERPRLRTRELEFTLAAREAAPLRRLPGFGAVVQRFGLDAYWDRFGWPAACTRTGGAVACH
jgi:TolB-like protein/DNA-binding winged helix-turn-helix (wHTH) protein